MVPQAPHVPHILAPSADPKQPTPIDARLSVSALLTFRRPAMRNIRRPGGCFAGRSTAGRRARAGLCHPCGRKIPVPLPEQFAHHEQTATAGNGTRNQPSPSLPPWFRLLHKPVQPPSPAAFRPPMCYAGFSIWNQFAPKPPTVPGSSQNRRHHPTTDPRSNLMRGQKPTSSPSVRYSDLPATPHYLPR